MNAVIIVAGGSGTRMNSPVPKQFILLAGKPLVLHTIGVFVEFDPDIRIILVLPQSLFGEWRRLIREHSFRVPHKLVAGGSSRFYSVQNGLNELETENLVAVHDGARPLVSVDLIRRTFSEAAVHESAIPVIPLTESIRLTEGNTSSMADRSRFRIVQTPQVFRTVHLKDAYRQVYREDFTDDASVIEAAGYPVRLMDGDPANIKITWPADLLLATALLTPSSLST
jgi:2-C-methyl-D-erythritol 4-phosphate cytidylyltransferase